MDTIRAILHFSDWANDQLLSDCAPLPPAQLDEPFPIGLGSLRKTLMHLLAGESVWLQRWQEQTEARWPDENQPTPVSEIQRRFLDMRPQRDRFLHSLGPNDLARVQAYRDSRGSLFKASLHDMILQVCMHSQHHRAQAVNMLRRLGAHAPELDYMYHVRQPA